ncbi:MAG: F0F1 ATP synthase subunit B [Ruminococcus sp.]|nr:F0F1 ATP synthase subunit B [Ruminococcus sp.]
MGNFEFFSFDLTSIVATICNTLIVFLIIKHFLFDKINAVLEERNADIARSYSEADEALRIASEKEKEYTERLSGARQEASQIVSDATKKAQTRSDQIVAEAKSEAREAREKALGDIEREKKQTVNLIKNEISDMAITIAAKVVSKEIDPAVHAALIDNCISELEEAV